MRLRSVCPKTASDAPMPALTQLPVSTWRGANKEQHAVTGCHGICHRPCKHAGAQNGHAGMRWCLKGRAAAAHQWRQFIWVRPSFVENCVPTRISPAQERRHVQQRKTRQTAAGLACRHHTSWHTIHMPAGLRQQRHLSHAAEDSTFLQQQKQSRHAAGAAAGMLAGTQLGQRP